MLVDVMVVKLMLLLLLLLLISLATYSATADGMMPLLAAAELG